MISTTSVKMFGHEVFGIETKTDLGLPGGRSLERRLIGVKEPPSINPDLLKPIAREAVAFLEPLAKNRVQSDPSFDESLASAFDSDAACKELAEHYTRKGVRKLTYNFLLLGPLSEQADVVPYFNGAIDIVVEKHWPEEKVVAS